MSNIDVFVNIDIVSIGEKISIFRYFHMFGQKELKKIIKTHTHKHTEKKWAVKI